MTKKLDESKRKQLRLTDKEKSRLMSDIRANKGIKYCTRKFKISKPLYYWYVKKVRSSDAEGTPGLMDTIQELQLTTVNRWRLRVLNNIMKDEAALMHNNDITMKQRISIRQSIINTLENTAHSIALTDFQSNIGSEGSTVPSELMDALVESIPEERRGAFIDELKNHTAARELAGKEEARDR